MAVIVQEMIFAEKGGVIFTKNVFGGKPQNLIVEAAAGLGEKVVSGLVNPERIMVNKNTGRVIEKEIVEQGVLAEKEVKALTEIAIKIEEFYQAPQDIEWAIKDNKIYILQSRPITP
jgi:pyruvate,water dikinase